MDIGYGFYGFRVADSMISVFTLSFECSSLLLQGFCSYNPVIATLQGTPIVNGALMSEDRFWKRDSRSRVINILCFHRYQRQDLNSRDI